MTENEARIIRSGFANGVEYALGKTKIEDCEETTLEHFAELVENATEKQVPKKPLKDEPSKLDVVQTYTCAVCGETIICSSALYCRRCGQRLDWSV